jgi:PhnB protein
MPEHDRSEQLDRAIVSALRGDALVIGADPELKSLTRIVTNLCHLPDENFRAALKNELLRRAAMTTSTSTAAGFRTVTPFIIHAQAPEMIDFIQRTFGAEELKRKTGEAIGFYSEVRIGDSVIMIGGGTAANWGNLPSALHVYVDDCDSVYQRALDAGAVTLMGELGRPADRPYGERSAFVRDAFGNYWYIATRLGSSAAPHTGSVLPYLHPENARKQIDFLRRAFGAEEMMVAEAGSRIMHGALRIGDAVVELGEPEDRAGIPTNGMFLFVEDVDAVYARALEAGATSYRPPADQPYGMRSAIVRDPAGYLWWPAKWIHE